MNVNPVNISNYQNNYKKYGKNIAFGYYNSEITKQDLHNVLNAMKLKGFKISDEKVEPVVKKLWHELETLKAEYIKDDSVKVHTFINNDEGRIYCMAQTSGNVTPKKIELDEIKCQYETRIFPIFYDISMVEQVKPYTDELKLQYMPFN